MNGAIKVDVRAIDIRENAWLEQRVIHRRIESRQLSSGATIDLDIAQPVITRLRSLLVNQVEVLLRVLLADVGLGVVDADEGVTNRCGDSGTLARIKGD